MRTLRQSMMLSAIIGLTGLASAHAAPLKAKDAAEKCKVMAMVDVEPTPISVSVKRSGISREADLYSVPVRVKQRDGETVLVPCMVNRKSGKADLQLTSEKQ